MKLVRKTLVLVLAFTLLLGTMTQLTSVLAAAVNEPDTTTIQNAYIKVTVENGTGRFGIRTVDGQPVRKKDQNVNMLFQGDDPETSFTTFRIDGTDYIFGNPYKFGANFFSEITPPKVVKNPNGTEQIETVWRIKGVAIKQILMLYQDLSDKKNAGNVNIRYEVANTGGASVEIGSRILLDTMVAGNDGPQFQIGSITEHPLTLERRLTHNPEAQGIPPVDVPYYKLPAYWVMKDNLDPSNPLATNVVAYGFNNIAEQNVNLVDEMIVGHWSGLSNTKWEYALNPNLDFARDTNDYGTADAAVAFYWNPKQLQSGKTQSFETVYGLGEIVEPDKVFSIRYIDPVQQMATLEDNSAYVNEGIIDITAEIENLASFNMTHDSITVGMTLEGGMSFVDLDEQGNIRRNPNGTVKTLPERSFEKTLLKKLTPEEAAQGVKSVYKPGDTVTTSFKVQVKGKPWPTTKEYVMTARSPQTESKLDGVKDEEIKAQYHAGKANFILLPAVGKAASTYVYGVSPKESFKTDVKYITVNLSNVEAYTTGNAATEPNFDLFLKRKGTQQRYKVPVKDSVILQPTDDGSTGDMRITYRGGDLVDAAGKPVQTGLGPELPVGEYEIQIDYKDDTGGDEAAAGLYDITAKQTFLVTENQATRIREAGYMAVYKQYVNLSGVVPNMPEAQLKRINAAFPDKPFQSGSQVDTVVRLYKKAREYVGTASRLADPKFDLSKYTDDDKLEKVAVYQTRLFQSKEQMDRFFRDNDGYEKLVDIRGMVREVGTGADRQITVDTRTEPAIINEAVAYKGKDIVFVKGKLDIFSLKNQPGYNDMPLFDSLIVKGEGTLNVANSGFIFHEGEWTLDFYNGFDKSVGTKLVIEDQAFPTGEDNPEDKTLNGSYTWATGALGDRLNPMRQLMIEHVYFNRHSLFSAPSFSLAGMGFKFNDFILRNGGISFGGAISFKVVDAEVRNVVFNERGFVGVDASLKFDLNKDLGLIGKSDKNDKKGKKDDPKGVSGKLYVTHYEQKVEGINNTYGVEFKADLKKMVEIQAALEFKKVDDGRILPNVIGFGTTLGNPGVPIAGATYLTAIRGKVSELADTIAGGTDKDPFPLVVQAGATIRFGVPPAYHFGDLDVTVKRTGLKIVGKMDFSTKPTRENTIEMLTKALLETQWTSPWFVRLEAEVNIGGWDVIMGKAGIFVGQNLEKNRIDFEGFIGARVQIPSSVPVVGGMPLSSVFFGVNNDKIWGSVGVLLITLGVTYYWGGGLEFGTSGEGLPDGLIHMVIEDPEKGPQLLVIGQGVEQLASSVLNAESDNQGIVYRNVAEGVSVLENVKHGGLNVGFGGIQIRNGGRIHEIPMDGVTGNALIEMEYTDAELPGMTLKDPDGTPYPIVFGKDPADPKANAFLQHVTAADSPDKVDVRRAYIIVPDDKVKAGKWTLTAVKPVETKLLNVPVAPKLTDIGLTKNSGNANLFTAAWKVSHPQADDKISLYLTKDAVAETAAAGQTLEPGDPGLLIAKDLPVGANGSGSLNIDVTKVSMLGDQEDIRGLLQQGNYYLRAELKSAATFSTKTSKEKFEIVDPLAPSGVTDVRIEPAGNGNFALSFKPAAKKPGQETYEHSYRIEALHTGSGKLAAYPNFGELLFTEEELAAYWNPEAGAYEGILLGGWVKSGQGESAEGDSGYVGLEVGRHYTIGVSSAVKPPKEADKNENYHFAERSDSANTLLPVPVKPKLTQDGTKSIQVLTNAAEQTIELAADQNNVEVEAFYAGQSIGKTALTNEGGGSKGTLRFTQFPTDGPYAIELAARNTRTKDIGVTMLYLTVDTLAPILYLEEPVTGARTVNGVVRVAGTTTADAAIWINGKEMKPAGDNWKVQDNGRFAGSVKLQDLGVASGQPTAELAITAKDKAGNENTAIVSVTHDGFQVPTGLILRKIPALAPGEKRAVEAFLRLPDGKDAQGKPKIKETAVPANDPRLTYTILQGSAASLSGTSELAGLFIGGSIIQADYRVSDDITLQAMAAVSVQGMESIPAESAAIPGVTGMTKLTVQAPGDMSGYEIAYHVFKSGTDAAKPQFQQNVSGWTALPGNGVVPAAAGDKIVLVKRSTKGKLAVGVSQAVKAKVNAAPGGGGGFFGGGLPAADKPDILKVNDMPLATEWQNDRLVARITKEAAAAVKSGDLVISSQDKLVKSYTFIIDNEARQQAVDKKQNIRLELPAASLTVKPEMLAGMTEALEIAVSPNGNETVTGLSAIAKELQATMLGDGHGVSIETNIPDSAWNNYVTARVPVPADVLARDITAVILRAADGSWTTLPWKLDIAGNEAFAEVQLTGKGSLAFVRNTNGYTDVPDDFWGKGVIEDASGKLFVLGKGEGRFDPAAQVTRAEYPTILLRVAGLMNKTAEAAFTDVGPDNWFHRSVAIAAGQGIVNGFGDGSFGPYATLSRVEGMVMAGRLLGKLGADEEMTEEEVSGILSGFQDGASIPDWARKPAALAIKKGIIEGEDNRINPEDTLTRAQAAAIAVRLDRLITGK